MKEYSRASFYGGLDKVSRVVAGKIEGSTLDRLTGQKFDGLDPKVKDFIAAKSAEFIVQLGRGHGLPSSEARASLRHYFNRLANGKRALFSEFAPLVLQDFKINALSKVPKGPGLVVINHPSGPLGGSWYTFALNRVVVFGGGLEPRWLNKAYSQNPLIDKVSVFRQVRERMPHIAQVSTGNIILDRSMHRAISGARGCIGAGGAVVLSCQGRESSRLDRIHLGVGRLAAAVVAKQNFPIYPCGVWQDGRNLNINFGKAVNVNRLLPVGGSSDLDKKACWQISDGIGVEIAKLLPVARRGFYDNYL